MDYSNLEAADGVVDVVEVALTKGLSAAKMTTLQRVSSHPKALGIGMASGRGGSSSRRRRRGSSTSLPDLNRSAASPSFESQPPMAEMTRRHSSSSASLRQLMRRGSTDTTGSAPLYVDFNDRPMSLSRRSSNGSLWSLNEEGDVPSFVNEVVAVDSSAVGKGVVQDVVGQQRRPSQNLTSTLSRGGSSRSNEEEHNCGSSHNRTPAVRRSSSTTSLRQLMRRGSIDTNDGTSSPPTVTANHPSRQMRRRSSASSLWSMPKDNLDLDEEVSGDVTDIAFARGLSAAKMETLQRVSTEHKTMRVL